MTDAKLKDTLRLDKTATGYAVVKDGLLDLRTVCETRNYAAANGIARYGTRILGLCRDPDCDCYVKAMKKLMPDARVVRVRVEVEGDG